MADKVSLCMIVRDEEVNLPRCLESVQGLVDEIVVVDTGSQDQTVAVAQHYGAVVREIPWRNDFAAARNESLSRASGDWVFCLDADEILAPESRDILPQLVASTTHEGYFVQIHNLLGTGDEYELEVGEALRLFRNRPSYRFTGAVHEQILPVIRAVTPHGEVSSSPLKVVHYGYLREHVAAKGKYDRNLCLLRAEVAGRPTDPFLQFNLGLELLLHSRFQDARRSFLVALASTPPAASWRPKLAKCYAAALCQLGRWQEALSFLESETQRYPGFTDLTYMKGVAHSHLRQHQKAAEAFAECLRLGPAPSSHFGAVDPEMGGPKAYMDLGREYETLGRYAEAMQAYAKAAMGKPGWIDPVKCLAALMGKRVDDERMVRVLEAFFRSGTAQDQVMVASLLSYAGRHRLAVERLELLIRTAEPGQSGKYAYAYSLAKLGRLDEALAFCDESWEGTAYTLRVQALKLYCQIRLDRCPGAELAAMGKQELRPLYRELAPVLAGDPPEVLSQFMRCLPGSRWLSDCLKQGR